jgi:hypothetical protein
MASMVTVSSAPRPTGDGTLRVAVGTGASTVTLRVPTTLCMLPSSSLRVPVKGWLPPVLEAVTL